MAQVRALKVEKLVFVLPDEFAGDEADALLLAARYMKERRRPALDTPTDPRANAKRAALEVLEGGGRLAAVMQLYQLDVPAGVLSSSPLGQSRAQGVVVPGIATP